MDTRRFLTLMAINGGWSSYPDAQLIGTVPEPVTMPVAQLCKLCGHRSPQRLARGELQIRLRRVATRPA